MTKIILLSLLIFFASTSHILAQTPKDATDSTDPAINTIKENVKKRIESVVKNQQTTTNQKIALVGYLTSVANDSLTIKTKIGNQLASTSPSTVYVDLKTSKNIKLDDIGIEDYISVLGFETESGVLDARRVILSPEPTAPKTITAFGMISGIDIDEEVLTITSSTDSQQIEFTINSKSLMFNQQGSTKSDIDFELLTTDIPVLIFYNPIDNSKDPQIIKELLVNNIPMPQPTAAMESEPTTKATPTPSVNTKKISPTPTPKLNKSTPTP